MMKTINLCVTGVLMCAGLGMLTACKDEKSAAPAEMPPAEVKVMALQHGDVQITQEWVATLRGTEDAEIRPQVTGNLLSKEYKDGEYVEKGQVLFQIDRSSFEAALKQAEGKLAQAEASKVKYALDVERYTPLVEKNAISQKQLDDAIQAEREAQANIVAAKASVDDATINLARTTIKAPLAGLAGISAVSVGNLLSPSTQAPLTTISALNPIRVDFAISEQDLLRADVKGNPNEVEKEERQGMPFDVILSTGDVFAEKGSSVALDRNVNKDTGTITVVGHIPNPDLKLRPGMFVRVRGVVEEIKGAAMVPPRAILSTQNAHFIIGVKPDNSVFMMPVKPGPVSGRLQVITSSIPNVPLPPQMMVIVEGIQQAAMRARTPKPNSVIASSYEDVPSQPTVASEGVKNDFDKAKPVVEPGKQGPQK